MKEFTVKFRLCDSEFLTALRLCAGAVCSLADLDVDAIEDFKVCVTESANILKNGGFEEVTACFSVDGSVCCRLSGEGGKTFAGDNELSLALIGALVSDCKIEKNGEVISKVTLKI